MAMTDENTSDSNSGSNSSTNKSLVGGPDDESLVDAGDFWAKRNTEPAQGATMESAAAADDGVTATVLESALRTALDNDWYTESEPPMLDGLLVANRGEIARRVFRSAHPQTKTIAVFSEPDRNAAHVRDADIAIALGGVTSTESYLDTAKVLEAAKRSGASAIHPGYGFLSENPDFAQAVMDAGLIWVGPTPDSIRKMALKVEAKRIAERAGVPLVPGAEISPDASDAELIAAATDVGFPLLVKASAGGGGKGMRAVDSADQLLEAVAGARREAQNSFGDPTVFFERYLTGARHVEVQVFGDTHGTCLSASVRSNGVTKRSSRNHPHQGQPQRLWMRCTPPLSR